MYYPQSWWYPQSKTSVVLSVVDAVVEAVVEAVSVVDLEVSAEVLVSNETTKVSELVTETVSVLRDVIGSGDGQSRGGPGSAHASLGARSEGHGRKRSQQLPRNHNEGLD